MSNAVEVSGVSKRFRFRSKAAPATFKDLAFTRVRVEAGFAIVDALTNVTFSLPRGCALGVVGENGSGKTTLLRILAGVTDPDAGSYRVQGSVAPLLSLGAGFNPYLTGRENAVIELLTLGLSRAQARRAVGNVIEFAELGEFIDAPMRTYSTGMAMRLAFSAAIHVDPDVLLIDEVLAVGDERFAAKCAAWLEEFRRRGKTMVLVTHNSSVVATQCDLALWLDRGNVAAFGDKMDVIRAYAREKNGEPVAAMTAPQAGSIESMAAVAEAYRTRLVAILPQLRLPLIGQVRQTGRIKGGYEDGWTDGRLDFSIEPLRDVRSWTVYATVPAGMPVETTVGVAIDGRPVAEAKARPGKMALHCDAGIPKEKPVNVRISTSTTVNHRQMGISEDVRNVGLRIDEIIFEH